VNGLLVLIAVSVMPNEYGKYPVESSYIIERYTLQRRIRKGYLKRI